MRFIKMKSFVVIIMLIGSASLFAQTKQEAVEAYNNGASLMTSDPVGALAAFEKCITISEQLGDEGQQTYDNAAKQIPQLHYKMAMTAYKKKDFPTAIGQFEKAMETGEKYGNDEIAVKANKVIPQVYNISATNHYKNKRYDEALKCYGKAVEYMPEYAKPFLGMASVYKKQGDTDKMLESCDKAIEIGTRTRDKKTVSKAQKLAMNATYNNAVVAIGKEQWSGAEAALNSSVEYGNETPKVYHQLGKVLSAQKKYDEALASLNKAVELDAEADDASKAKYYYELGNVFVAKGDNAAACDAYKKAMYGDYAANAKYQVEQVLKCQ